MNVAVFYCYPMMEQRTYYPLAVKFAESWRRFAAGAEHNLYIITNGPVAKNLEQRPFNGIQCHWLNHNNCGWDIGAYLTAARTIASDLMVCLGAHITINKAGWLRVICDSYIENGPGLYGAWGMQYPNWHIRTTGFWCPRELLVSYPFDVYSTRKSRYAFEHGPNSLTAHVSSMGFPCLMVTTRGCFARQDWSAKAPSITESILLDKHHE